MAEFYGNPFATKSGSSKSSLPSYGLPMPSGSGDDELTARQMALLMTLKKRDKHFSLGALLKKTGKKTLNPVLWTFDKLMRPSWAIAGAVNEGTSKKGGIGEALHGAREGFMGRERVGMGEVLSNHGVLKGHGRLRGVAGLGLDIATDPLMLLSAAAAPFTGGGSVAAYAALKSGTKVVGEAALKEAAKRAAYDAGRHALEGKADDTVEEILTHAGKGYEARLALAKQGKHDLAHMEAEKAAGRELPESWFASRAAMEDAAHAEERRVTERGAQLRYGTRKHNIHTPITVAGKRVAPHIPKIGGGRQLPVVSHLVDSFGKRFIPGYKREELHALELSRQHYAESAAITQRDAIKDIMKGGDAPGQARLTKEIRQLDREEQLHALHMFEQPMRHAGKRLRAVIKDKEGRYILNPTYVARMERMHAAGDPMGLSEAQVEFVKRFHNATQYLHVRDKAAGVVYKGAHLGEKGRLYVPHLLDRSGEKFSPDQTAKNILSESGFMKKRSNSAISMAQIHKLVEEGRLPNAVETDPYKLLTHTSRARAEKQADMAMIRATEKIAGKPTRLVDDKAVERALGRNKTAAAKVRGALRVLAHHEDSVQARQAMLVEEVKHQFNDQIEQLEKAYKQTKFGKYKAPTAKVAPKAVPKPVSPALIKAVEHAQAQVDEAADITARLPEDFPKHNAKILGELEQLDHLSAEVDDFREIRRSDYDHGPDGTEDFQGDKIDAWESVKDAHEAHVEELADELKDAIQSAKPKATKPGKATTVDAARSRVSQQQARKRKLTLLQNRIDSITITRDSELLQLSKGSHPLQKELLKEPKVAVKAAKEALKEAKAELAASKKSYDRATLGKHNPAVKGLTKVPASVNEWGHQYAYPKEVAESITRLRKITAGDEHTIAQFAKGYAKMLSVWKLLVTSVNPGYRIRNTSTDFWNMWVSGVPAHAIPVYGRRAAKVMAAAKKGDQEAAHILVQAATHGVMSGLYTGDVQAVASYLKLAGRSYKSKNLPASYVKAMQDINRNAENWGRLTHYLYQTEGRKLPAAEGALKVKLAHFDYEDLTPFEQKVMKNVFPFYTWTRKNIPFQVKMIIQHPGRYAAFPKIVQESQYQSDADPNEEIPGYLADNFAFNIGKHRLLSPQFGVSDLAPLQGPGQAYDRMKGMITPAAKVPIELMTNKSLFSGQPIVDDKHPRAPVNRLGAGLLSMLPGSDVGQTTRNGVTGPGANPYYAYLLSQIPALRVATVATGGIKGKTPGTNPLLSYFGGLSTSTVDPEAQKSFMTQDAQQEADRTIQGLRDAGILPPAKKRKRTKKDRMISNQAFTP